MTELVLEKRQCLIAGDGILPIELAKKVKENGLENLLISTSRGQIINRELFDCDYYDFLEKNTDEKKMFDGEFLSDYSWGEYILGDIMRSFYYNN